MTLTRTALLAGRQLSRSCSVTGRAARLALKLPRLANNVASVRSLASASAGTTLQSLAVASPHVEAVRYEHKNVKWTLKHIDYHSDSLAIGLLENGLKPGDVVLSWLPLHFGEQHILQFACSKAGFVLYNLDPSLAIGDPEAAKKALGKALELTEANVLISQEAGDDVNYANLVESVIPETRIFDFTDGLPFFTPRYPHLRFPIHTGFDYEENQGMVPLYDMLCNTGDLEGSLGGDEFDGSTPLLGQLAIGGDGIPTKKGKTLTNDEVIAQNVWPEFNAILKKEYLEVEGVGVIF